MNSVRTVAYNITVPHLSGIFVNIDRVADVWTEHTSGHTEIFTFTTNSCIGG